MPSRRTPVAVLALVLAIILTPFLAGCGGGGSSSKKKRGSALVVTSSDDTATPPAGTVTLRSALAAARNGQRITFDASLDGKTITLSVVGADHTVLKGEVMGIKDEPSGPVSFLVGYFERDYGRSALYARKDVVIDASALPNGITFAWAGGAADHARVLAVFGDLTMTNVTITGGMSQTEDIKTGNPEDQPWTLARGAGVAVWGRARLTGCTIHDNHCVGDFEDSRDRGAFGGGVYANLVDIDDCVISGNTVLGAGAAGGGVYSVGGAEKKGKPKSVVRRSSLTGNRISALFTYGAGIYSDGGGIGNSFTLRIENTTIARNRVDPPPGMPPFLLGIGYWRGGGVYVSNGSLEILSSTIVENEVVGMPRTDSLGKQNLAGGIAATIGNAHAVEHMIIGHSIIAGNTVEELGFPGAPVVKYDHDIFTGTLVHFRSRGYNRIGVLDFNQILVPVGQYGWASLCRKHYPMEGDEDGVDVADALDVAGATTSGIAVSKGAGDGTPAVLRYEPRGTALDRVPAKAYAVREVLFDYDIDKKAENDFLEIFLGRLENHIGLVGFAQEIADEFEAHLRAVDTDEDEPGLQPHLDPDGNPIYTLAQTQWFGPKNTWPKEIANWAYVEFWHYLDQAIRDRAVAGMGVELIGDAMWADLFTDGRLDENRDITMRRETTKVQVRRIEEDQRGTARPTGVPCDIGAIEVP